MFQLSCLRRIPPGSNWKDLAEDLERNDDNIFEIEKVVGKRMLESREWEYLVLWVGYPIEEAS